MSKITSVERVPYRGWVYGFEVEEDESYVANGLVVHNCEEGVNPEAKFDIISKSLNGSASAKLAVETYLGLPVIRKLEAVGDEEGIGSTPDGMAVEEEQKSSGDAYSEPNPEANAPLLGKAEARIGKAVNEAELLRYLGAFKSLFQLYNNTGGLEIVLYDPVTGELLLEEDGDESWISPPVAA